ncbi:hypothetical protein TeGR_g8762, partial [Tetraparma gracilis]
PPTPPPPRQYDAFKSADSDDVKDNISYSFLQLIERYASLIPLSSASYDFSKLLPPSASVFFARPAPLRSQLVRALLSVSKSAPVKWSAASLSTVLSIAIEDPCAANSDLASAALRTQSAGDAEAARCYDFEAACFLGKLRSADAGDSDSLVASFTSTWEGVSKNSLSLALLPAKCCSSSSSSFPEITFSTLLTACVVSVFKKPDPAFESFVADVCAKVSRFVRDPAPLCVMITSLAAEAGHPASSPIVADAAAVLEKRSPP